MAQESDKEIVPVLKFYLTVKKFNTAVIIQLYNLYVTPLNATSSFSEIIKISVF